MPFCTCSVRFSIGRKAGGIGFPRFSVFRPRRSEGGEQNMAEDDM